MMGVVVVLDSFEGTRSARGKRVLCITLAEKRGVREVDVEGVGDKKPSDPLILHQICALDSIATEANKIYASGGDSSNPGDEHEVLATRDLVRSHSISSGSSTINMQ
jgi:hypothetical protein